MAEFQINDEDLAGFEGKVAIITGRECQYKRKSMTDPLAGGSSGIGLATVSLLSSLGALVVSGDIQEPPTHDNRLHVSTDVRKWADLTKLFKTAKETHGKIDYVFANAGIGPRADYLDLAVDESGEIQEPNKDTLDINFSSVVNTVTLGAHHLKTQPEGGSIVIMGSSTGLHPMRAVDYCMFFIRFIHTSNDLLLMASL